MQFHLYPCGDRFFLVWATGREQRTETDLAGNSLDSGEITRHLACSKDGIRHQFLGTRFNSNWIQGLHTGLDFSKFFVHQLVHRNDNHNVTQFILTVTRLHHFK